MTWIRSLDFCSGTENSFHLKLVLYSRVYEEMVFARGEDLYERKRNKAIKSEVNGNSRVGISGYC